MPKIVRVGDFQGNKADEWAPVLALFREEPLSAILRTTK